MTTFIYGRNQMMLALAWNEELPVDIGDPVTIEREFATVSGAVVNSWPLLDGWYQYIIEVL